MGPNIIEDDREDAAQQLSKKIREKGKRYNRPENSNVVRDKTYNQPLGRATHRYPIRDVIQQVNRNPTQETNAPQASALITTRETRTQLDEPQTNENITPFLLNTIIDDDTGEVDIKALVHGIEVLENKINAITCPTTGNQLEYRHRIQEPATKEVWHPTLSTEVDRLVSTQTNRFMKNRDTPKDEKAVYTRLVVDLRPNKAVHERLRMCMGGDNMESVMDTTTRIADLNTCKLHMNGVVSTPGVRFAGGDVNGFYLNTPPKKKIYGKAREKYIPEETIKKHNLNSLG